MSGVEAPPPQMTQGLGCLVPIGSGLVGFGPCGVLVVKGRVLAYMAVSHADRR